MLANVKSMLLEVGSELRPGSSWTHWDDVEELLWHVHQHAWYSVVMVRQRTSFLQSLPQHCSCSVCGADQTVLDVLDM